MPRTTINVIFGGRDNGLVNLFQRIDQSVSALDRNMNRLEATISRVDSRFKSLKSNSGFLSSLGGGRQANVSSVGSIGLRGFQQSIASGSSIISGILGRTASMTSSVFKGVTSTISGAVSSAYRNVTSMISFVDKAIMTFGNSIRQIAQGIQSFGIAFSIFVSAPLAGMLRGVVTEAVNYDDALTLVRKTTGATQQDIDKLGESLTQLSLNLPTSREDLAKIAEDWGAIGIAISDQTGVETMTELTRLTSMFVSSVRGVTAEDAVEKLGRFAAIYYPDIASFVGEAEKLMSTLSALEDVTPLDAGEIMAAAQRLAPVTKSLEIAPQRALALAAAVASVNVSAERAGTQTSTALIDMVTNIDKVAELFGTTEDKIQSLMSESPDEFFYTLAASIGAVEDPLRRVQIVEEVFGKVGGKSIGSLVNSIPNLSAILKVANDEFMKGTYLQWQFAASLESSKSQLQILRNNITYAGSAIGDALLPYITKFVTIAVPAIQMLTEWFKGLDEGVKIQIVGWIAFLAIAGPVTVFFSSLLFMVGLTISGLSSLFGVVGMVGQGLVGFLSAIIGFLSPVNLLVAAIAGMAIYSVYVAKDLLLAGTVVQSYISKFYEWGYNLISSFASGISSAASAAYNAVVSVINSFIGLIQSFSPPKKGPLRNITQWGANLMISYSDGIASAAPAVVGAVSYVNEQLRKILEGFSPSTLSMFSSVFNSIKSVINSVGAHIGLATEDMNARIEYASTAVASFIQNLKAGVPDGLQEIAGFLGGLSGDFESLIIMQNRYADGEARLRQIESALKGINAETDKMIAGVISQNNLTADQQSAMVRRIKLEQAAKEQALQAEQSSLQAQQDNLKNDIDKKQEIIDILSSLIFPAGASGAAGYDKIDKPEKPEKPGIEPIDLVPFKDASGVLQQVKERFDQTGQSAETFTQKLGQARLMVEGFVAAIRGDDKKNYAEMPDAFWKGWAQGENVRNNVIEFMNKLEAIWGRLQTVKDAISDSYFAYLTGFSSGKNGGKINWDMLVFLGGLSAAALVLGWAMGTAAKSVEDFVTNLFSTNFKEDSGIGVLIERINKAITAFKNGLQRFGQNTDYTILIDAMNSIAEAVLGLSTSETLWYHIGTAIGAFGFALAYAAGAVGVFIEWIKIFLGYGDKEAFVNITSKLVAMGDASADMDRLRDAAGKVYDVYENIYKSIQNVINKFKEWKNMLFGGSEEQSTPTTSASGGGSTSAGSSQNPSGGGGSRGFGEAGEKTGKSFISGLTTYLGSKTTAQEVSTAMVQMADNAQMGATKQTGQTGEFFGGDFLTGVKNWFANVSAYGLVMGTLVTSISTWRETTGKTALETHGNTSGGDFLTGVDTKFDTDTGYFTTLVERMGAWIIENAKQLLDIGKSIGQAIIGGMTDAIKGGKDAFWGAIKGLLDYAWSVMPDWFKKFWEMIHGKDSGDSESGKEKESKSGGSKDDSATRSRSMYGTTKPDKYTPYVAPQQNDKSNVNITINIDPSIASQIDRRNIDRLAEEIYTKLVRDMKLAGV